MGLDSLLGGKRWDTWALKFYSLRLLRETTERKDPTSSIGKISNDIGLRTSGYQVLKIVQFFGLRQEPERYDWTFMIEHYENES